MGLRNCSAMKYKASRVGNAKETSMDRQQNQVHEYAAGGRAFLRITANS